VTPYIANLIIGQTLKTEARFFNRLRIYHKSSPLHDRFQE
jgi:hypothetical protein